MRKALGNKRAVLLAGLLGLLLAGMVVLGRTVSLYGTTAAGRSFLRTLIPFLLLALAFWAVLVALLVFLPRGIGLLVNSKAERGLARFFCSEKRSRYWILAGVLFLCWLPALLAYYPGIFAYDIYPQSVQVLTGEYSTHHPLLHTLFLGVFLRIGAAAQNYGLGVLLYSLCQMGLFALLLAWALRRLERLGLPATLQLLALLFVALNPLNGIFAISATKDSLFSVFLLLFLLSMVELLRAPQQFLHSGWAVARLVGFGALMLLLRNQAVYVLALTLPFVVWACRPAWKRALAAGLLVVVVGVGAGTALRGVLHAEKGSVAEILSMPTQQLARVYTLHRDELDTESRAALEALVPADIWQRYRPDISDPVKMYFNEEAFSADKGGYLKLYLHLGWRYPREYLDAFLLNNLGYWYPGGQYMPGVTHVETQLIQVRLEVGDIWLERTPHLPWLTALYESVAKSSRMWTDALPLWVMLIGLSFLLCNKRYKWLPPLVFLLVYWLTLMVSPVVNGRYVVPLLLALSFLVPLALGPGGLMPKPTGSTNEELPDEAAPA